MCTVHENGFLFSLFFFFLFSNREERVFNATGNFVGHLRGNVIFAARRESSVPERVKEALGLLEFLITRPFCRESCSNFNPESPAFQDASGFLLSRIHPNGLCESGRVGCLKGRSFSDDEICDTGLPLKLSFFVIFSYLRMTTTVHLALVAMDNLILLQHKFCYSNSCLLKNSKDKIP